MDPVLNIKETGLANNRRSPTKYMPKAATPTELKTLSTAVSTAIYKNRAQINAIEAHTNALGPSFCFCISIECTSESEMNVVFCN